MGIGEDCDQLGTDSDGRNARKDKDPSDPDPNGAPLQELQGEVSAQRSGDK
jgi:hypothetical protein